MGPAGRCRNFGKKQDEQNTSLRFVVGGVVVSAFSMLGDILRPKSFAGLFGAAPSVALATLGIAVNQHGVDYTAQQSWAMTAGAIALAVYSIFVCHLLSRAGLRAAPATLLSLVVLADCRLRSTDARRRANAEADPLFAVIAQGRPLVRIPGSLRTRRRRDRLHRPYQQPLWSYHRRSLPWALPAIFCASATLIEKHEIRRKREAGLDGRRRAEEAAALDAAGAALPALACWPLRSCSR